MTPVVGDRDTSARLYRYVSRFYDTIRPLFAGFRETQEEYFSHLDVGSDHRVLDVGCGTGESTRRFVGERRTVHGIDLSAAQIEQTKAKRDLDTAEFVVGDALALPYRSDTFDVVASVGALQHVPDVRAALSEMERVTVPGGHLFVVGPKRPENLLGGALADGLAHFLGPADVERQARDAKWVETTVHIVTMRFLLRDAVVLTARSPTSEPDR